MQFQDGTRQVLEAVRFLSRLPMPQGDHQAADLAVTLRAAPVAGVLIAAGPAFLLCAASGAGLPSLPAAALSVTALVAVTGGLHEDGLADVADGFGGGVTVSRKLSIMRDSRIGTYGTLAIGLALLLRVGALQALVDRLGAGSAALVMLAAAAVSRGLMLVPLAMLSPARPDGLGRAAGPEGRSMLAPALVAAGLTGAVLVAIAVPDRLLLLTAGLWAGAAALAVTRLARHHVRGVTGDVIGAAQQAAEVAVLLALCTAALPR